MVAYEVADESAAAPSLHLLALPAICVSIFRHLLILGSSRTKFILVPRHMSHVSSGCQAAGGQQEDHETDHGQDTVQEKGSFGLGKAWQSMAKHGKTLLQKAALMISQGDPSNS